MVAKNCLSRSSNRRVDHERKYGDTDYELSLSDSEEEASANDESSDDQRNTGSKNHHVLLLPTMQRQQLLSKLQHLVFLPCYVLQGLLNFQGNRQSIVIRFPRERSVPKVPILTVIHSQSRLNIKSIMHSMLKNV